MSDDTYPNAGRDSGYTDAEGNPVGEDLVNKLTVLVSGIETKILLQGQQTREDIARLAEQNVRIDTRQQNADVASLSWRTELRTHIDSRFDRFGTELDELKTEVSRLGGLEARVERVEVGQAKLEIKVDSLETQGAPATAVSELAQIDKRLSRVEFWVVCLVIAITANALLYALVISAGGGR